MSTKSFLNPSILSSPYRPYSNNESIISILEISVKKIISTSRKVIEINWMGIFKVVEVYLKYKLTRQNQSFSEL